MQFSPQFSTQWHPLLRNLQAGWLGRAFPAATNPPSLVPLRANAQVNGNFEQDQPQPPKTAQATANHPDGLPQPTTTPAQWLASLAPHTAIVVYIDHGTCQIMEMLALSRKQLPEFVRNPAYTHEQARWLAIGQTRLRRQGFAPATAFQQQEDALGAVEDLLSARWHASAQLRHLDQEIARAFASAGAVASASGTNLTAPNPAVLQAHLTALLATRQIASDELARLDEVAISAFQRFGVALLEQASGPCLPSGPA